VYLFTGTLLPVLPTIVAQLGKLCVPSHTNPHLGSPHGKIDIQMSVGHDLSVC